MSLRAPKDTIQSLQVMLQRLEQSPDPSPDPETRAEIKRILLSRIANLEAVEILRVEALKSADRKKPAAPLADPRPATQSVPVSPSASPQKPLSIEAAPRQPDPSDPVVTR